MNNRYICAPLRTRERGEKAGSVADHVPLVYICGEHLFGEWVQAEAGGEESGTAGRSLDGTTPVAAPEDHSATAALCGADKVVLTGSVQRDQTV